MKKKSLTVCPVCGSRLKILKYKCQSCNAEIQGTFEICDLCVLNDEQMEFLKVFLREWGNLSEVARKLGISYPTVRQRYREILETLGYEVASQHEETDISQLIDMLYEGKISVDEVLRKLKEGKNE